MKELKCPKCGSVFSVDEADYSFILQQVKTAEFNAEVDRRLGELLKNEETKTEMALDIMGTISFKPYQALWK